MNDTKQLVDLAKDIMIGFSIGSVIGIALIIWALRNLDRITKWLFKKGTK